jgi:PhzF family phenazine biosynthesis protein
MDIGIAGPHPPSAEAAFEVRAFFPKDGATIEDPVTGSFNASLGQWLLATGRAQAPYIARQGTALGRRGEVHITSGADGTVWVGGGVVTCISGTIDM